MKRKEQKRIVSDFLKKMAEGTEQVKVVLLMPEPFHTAWTDLLSLCEDTKRSEAKLKGHPHWPILALGIKAASTTQAIGSLGAMRQWPDALILGRSLFETEILVKWILQEDTDIRVKKYLDEIIVEEKKILRKMVMGKSITAQIFRDIYNPDNFLLFDEKQEIKKTDKKSVKEMARQTAIERSYDIGYWIESHICHSHVLSLSQWNEDLLKMDSPFVTLFGFKDKDFPSWMVLEALPAHCLDTIQLVDSYFNLGLARKIELVREEFREIVRKVSKGKVQFTSEIERGDIKLVFENGDVRHISSNKTGTDPVDKLLKE